MGAPWAPSYACLHLGLWEEEVVFKSSMYLSHCRLWLRYIDDVLMVWEGSAEQLVDFVSQLNINERNIRLTYTYHGETLPFLDLQITKSGDRLTTCTFRKETAANTLLLAQSHHPKPLINRIPTGQFLRIRRNCSEDKLFLIEAGDLYQLFRERGYSHLPLKKAKDKALKSKREDLLVTQKRPQQIVHNTEAAFPRIITKFSSQWTEVQKILNKHWHILRSAPLIANIVSPRPLLTAKRARNLGDTLVHSEYK